MTCIPATITDLVTTDRALHLEGFDFVSPDPVAGEQDSSPSPDEGVFKFKLTSVGKERSDHVKYIIHQSTS